MAECQGGVVSSKQLRSVGLSDSGIRHRVASGRLHRVHHGVYAVGHSVIAVRGRWWAAVLACGESAVLSHRSAGDLWGLQTGGRSAVDVTSPRGAGRSRPGIQAHHSLLHPTDATTHDRLPCTTVARTLVDLTDVLNRRGVERAVDRAETLRIFDLTAVEAVLARSNGRRGASALRSILAAYADPKLTRNELEEALLAICIAAGLPPPMVNVWIPLNDGLGPGYEADFFWPQYRLIVETDGGATHGTRRAFAHDRKRDRRLMLAGYRVVRFTWDEVLNDPQQVARTLAALLAQAA